MNAVFEPSLLFISDEDWQDEIKQDDFLKHLLEHLEIIDEYDICDIWWTEELQTILVGTPNMHPWFGSDLKNSIIVIIHQKFYNRIEYTIEFDTVCSVSPALAMTYVNQNAHEHFLKLIHTLIDLQDSFYLCVGLSNKLNPPGQYAFSCDCHGTQLSPPLLNNANDWLQYIDLVEKFFPTTIEEFDEKFEKGMGLVKRKAFLGKNYLFNFEFTKNFKKSIIDRTTCREEIFVAVVKRLVSTNQEAGRSDLGDEVLNQRKERRMRVTQRPTSTRIHYNMDDEGKLTFLCYYGEGEHDDRL